ncbi:condensin subunit [Martiniozyma asiatica (nom. inval.)]|nr:condensin subunit [Martiniozyma asiatica]
MASSGTATPPVEFELPQIVGLNMLESPKKSLESLSPRLVIHQLVLHNFKSYAGRQIIGPFHESFSAVVGPNGSGKSNVIDSLLFVFGFRASKMRQSKLSELIHNSETFPDLQFCQVDIHFKRVIDSEIYNDELHQLTNITQDIPNSELIVSRKATRNNQSIYYINNKLSNYTEVTTMMKEEGIDLDHKRFLILQGEVEMISQMKPKAEGENDDGLLEYLEDIIGTSKYKLTIEELSSKIEQIQEEILLKNDEFKLLASGMLQYEKEKDKSLLFLEKEKIISDLEQTFHFNTIKKFQLEKSENELKLDLLNKEIGNDKKIIDKLSNNLNNFLIEKESLVKNFKKIDENYQEIKIKQRKAQKSKFHKKKNDSIKKEIEIKGKDYKSQSNELINIKNDLSTFDLEIDQINNKLESENELLNQIKSNLSEQTKEYTDKISKVQKKLEPWNSKFSVKDHEFKLKQSEISMKQQELNILNEDELNAKNDYQTKKEIINVNKVKIEKISQKFKELTGGISQRKNVFIEAEENMIQLEQKLNKARDQYNYAQKRLSNTETQNKVLNALQNLQKTGRIKGFYGRLGDLGTIPDEYDVAISTGGGPLDDFVVEKVEAAQICIEYLRNHNLGRGRFIVLEKLKKFDLSKKSTPMNIPRLFDLIDPQDSKFAPAFYNSMYDTLVAANIDQATKAAYGTQKRWRVITLDGKLVDTSGAMSGGGNRVNKGAMKLKSQKISNNEFSETQINELYNIFSNLENEYKQKEQQFLSMKNAMKSLEEQLPLQEEEMRHLKFDNDNILEELKVLQERIKEFDNNKIKREEIIKNLNNGKLILDNIEKDKSDILENSKALQDEISTLQKKIMDIGGIELKKQTSIVNDLKSLIQNKNQMKEKNELRMVKLESNLKKLESLLEKQQIELSKTETDKVALEEKFKEMENLSQKLEKELQEEEEKKIEIENKLHSIEESIDEEKIKLDEKNESIGQLVKSIEKLNHNIIKANELIDHSNKLLNKLIFRDVTEIITWIDKNDEKLEKYLQKNIVFNEEINEKELKALDLKDEGEEIESLKKELSQMDVNLSNLPEYGEKKKNYDLKELELNKIKEDHDLAKDELKKLNDGRFEEFQIGFNKISETLKEMYYMITNGGVAELEYFDVHDPFQEGIIFSVMPPKKSWRNISNLSGGEKTLASLALVFALHQYKPTPLYVMDEIDAALDFKNVSIIANYIQSRTKNAQFIVISLRNNMFELAKYLVGIYKVNNMTRSVTLVNEDLVELAKKNQKSIS